MNYASDALIDALKRENEHLRDDNAKLRHMLDECGKEWIRLPVDADGVPIHAGEELFWKEDGTSAGRVTAIGVGDRAGWVWLLRDGNNVSIGRRANKLCHIKFDTWESIIADALGCDTHEVAEDDDLMALVERCKALAGDTE
jgi:hypothetical protein